MECRHMMRRSIMLIYHRAEQNRYCQGKGRELEHLGENINKKDGTTNSAYHLYRRTKRHYSQAGYAYRTSRMRTERPNMFDTRNYVIRKSEIVLNRCIRVCTLCLVDSRFPFR